MVFFAGYPTFLKPAPLYLLKATQKIIFKPQKY
jgi:hypothetical protein